MERNIAMYCSNCGLKQQGRANFCASCGNSLFEKSELTSINLKETRKIHKWRNVLVTSFIAYYCFLFFLMYLRYNDPYYYDSLFFPYGLFQVLMIVAAFTCGIAAYKLAGNLIKPTFVIVIYTLLAPFVLINLISFIGLLADSKKSLQEK
ncbi:hypothetical protein [Bacillus sp. UMB0728]|uniref:hypothetical protein n=1 Tax=Bacillus sp. UMB0728 TaxID=2066052 RepID=UPI00115BD7BE|nr:hypothetical protein [Bacillus sp. UMB0728]